MYAEIFFDPQAHTSRNISYTTVVQGFEAACKRAEKELGITTILTSCFLRHLPVVDSLHTFRSPEVQESYRNGTVKAIGLDSSEKDFPPHLFEELYHEAKSQGLHLTAHAGEEGPPSFIADALSKLKVERIDRADSGGRVRTNLVEAVHAVQEGELGDDRLGGRRGEEEQSSEEEGREACIHGSDKGQVAF